MALPLGCVLFLLVVSTLDICLAFWSFVGALTDGATPTGWTIYTLTAVAGLFGLAASLHLITQERRGQQAATGPALPLAHLAAVTAGTQVALAVISRIDLVPDDPAFGAASDSD
jgi:hypothetical protein